MNLFARGLGGFMSDNASARMGMRGRILIQTIFIWRLVAPHRAQTSPAQVNDIW
jgi:hypothetical protein